MAKKFKVGDEVVIIEDTTSYGGRTLNKGQHLLIVMDDQSRYYPYYCKLLPEHNGVKVLIDDSQVELANHDNQVDPEPDYYVYPDTPVGTELVLTRSIKGLNKHYEIPKGATCILTNRRYFAKGGARQVAFTGEFENYGLCFVDCDSLMLKGYKVD